ncbi:unnamed protein product [Urochloa decumbens]|uniref:F-box domain-containing protein n=1 Tax=Urochloa decumbens TaxID=240449 RepID=A0ABC9FPT3_9POAL
MSKDKSESKMALMKKSPARPMTVNDVPDKLLELILLHLTSPVCIIRAAAACRRWRRVLTSIPFLSRLLQRHPHPVAGHYLPQPPSGSCSSPQFVPSSQEISIDRRRFSLDFLPAGGGKSWRLVDSRSSLLLLARKKGGWMRHCFPDLVVCEPLTRFYRLVPRPPEMKRHECLGVFLKVYGNNMPEPNFCVTCVLYESYTGVSGDVGTVRVCVFGWGRRGIRRWRVGPRSAIAAGLHLSVHGKDALQFVGCAMDASFWWVRDENPQRRRLICAHSTAQVSLYILPEHISRLCVDTSGFRVVNGNDDKVRIVCLEGAYLKVFSRSYWNHGDNDWVLEKQVNFVMATCELPGRKECLGNVGAKIVMVSGRCVMLGSEEAERCLISIELETMRIQRMRIGRKRPAAAYPYQLPWPPRFHACLCQCKWRGKGPCYENCTC